MTSDFWPQSREGMSLCTEPPVCVPRHSSARSPTPCGATPDGGAPPQRGRGKGPQGARLAVASRGPRISEAPGSHPSRTGAQQGVAHGRCPLKHPFQPQGEASEQRTGRVHVRSGARPVKLRDPAGRGAGGDGWTWTARRYLAASAGEERRAGLSAREARAARERRTGRRGPPARVPGAQRAASCPPASEVPAPRRQCGRLAAPGVTAGAGGPPGRDGEETPRELRRCEVREGGAGLQWPRPHAWRRPPRGLAPGRPPASAEVAKRSAPAPNWVLRRRRRRTLPPAKVGPLARGAARQ